MYECKKCGAVDDYSITITTDGYKEYRCNCCNSILYRVNLIEEYASLNTNHISYSNDTDLDKLCELKKKYTEDYNAVNNYINYLFSIDNQDNTDVVHKLIREYTEVKGTAKKYINDLDARIRLLKKEIRYERVSTEIAAGYDPKKDYSKEKINQETYEDAKDKFESIKYILVLVSIIIGGLVFGIIWTIVVGTESWLTTALLVICALFIFIEIFIIIEAISCHKLINNKQTNLKQVKKYVAKCINEKK